MEGLSEGLKAINSVLGSVLNFTEIGQCSLKFVAEMFEFEHCAHAGQEFKFVDRFAHKIISTRVNASFNVSEFIQGCDHYDGDITGLWVILEAFAYFKSTHFWHHDVQQEQIGLMPCYHVQCFGAIVGCNCLALNVLEVGLKQFEVLNIVIHDKDHGYFVIF